MARKNYTVLTATDDAEVLGDSIPTKVGAFDVALQKMASRSLPATLVVQNESGREFHRSWLISSVS